MEKNQQKSALWLALLAALTFGVACSQAEQAAKKKKKGEKEPAEETEGSGEGADPTGAGEGEGDDLNDLGEGEDGDAAAKLTSDCGGTGVTDKDPEDVVYEKTIESLKVTNESEQPLVGKVTAVVQTSLEIRVTGKETKQTTDVTLVSITPALAKLFAEGQLKANEGTTTLANVPFKEYPNLSKDKQWDGVLCTFVPVSKIENGRGGKSTVATFDPPLPSSVSPKAVAERYKEEIGDKRVFKGIKVTIKSSDDPELKDVKTLTGDVTVEKVDADTEVDDGSGGKKSIKADLAYKVTNDFGDAKKTFALGLPPVVTYYISHSKKDMVANTVDTTETGTSGAFVVFIHK